MPSYHCTQFVWATSQVGTIARIKPCISATWLCCQATCTVHPLERQPDFCSRVERLRRDLFPRRESHRRPVVVVEHYNNVAQAYLTPLGAAPIRECDLARTHTRYEVQSSVR